VSWKLFRNISAHLLFVIYFANSVWSC